MSNSSPPTLSQPNTPHDWMQLALQQAHHSLYVSDPNPRVGCVLVNQNNQCIGIGHTQQAGQPHAEVMALQDAKSKGNATKGATAYVTLEPCSHYGRTPPCTQAIIKAGIKHVVIATLDPNPQVNGHGVRILEDAGITVEHGLLAHKSQELNIGFFSRMQRKRPWVRLKMATSLDGKNALTNGQSQWITGTSARADGHTWRARASAVLTGIGTILSDDPQLNVRALNLPKQPWHVILDTQLRTPPTANIFKNQTPVLIYTQSTDLTKESALTNAGATVIQIAANKNSRFTTGLDLNEILKDLAQKECNELHVEAGSILSSAFLKAGLVDELLLYMAPRFIGIGHDFLQGLAINTLKDTIDFSFHDIQMIEDDLRLILRK